MGMASFAKVPTVSLRRALGIRARRPGKFQNCVGGTLKGKTYSKPPVNMGGRNNVEVHRAFYDAAKSCGANVKKARP